MLISDEVRNAILNAALALVNGGDMLFREGATTRLTFTLKTPAAGNAAAGVALLDVASPLMTAVAASSAAVALDNYQIRTSGGAVRFSGDIGALASGAEVEMSHPNVIIGDVVQVTEFEFTQPAGA